MLSAFRLRETKSDRGQRKDDEWKRMRGDWAKGKQGLGLRDMTVDMRSERKIGVHHWSMIHFIFKDVIDTQC